MDLLISVTEKNVTLFQGIDFLERGVKYEIKSISGYIQQNKTC